MPHTKNLISLSKIQERSDETNHSLGVRKKRICKTRMTRDLPALWGFRGHVVQKKKTGKKVLRISIVPRVEGLLSDRPH